MWFCGKLAPMKPIILLPIPLFLSIAAQQLTTDNLLPVLTQLPFVVATIWLFLRLADKQEITLKNINDSHNETIRLITEKFEQMDHRRSSDNSTLIATLLSIIAEDNLDHGQTQRLATGLKSNAPSTKTQEFLLKRLENK